MLKRKEKKRKDNTIKFYELVDLCKPKIILLPRICCHRKANFEEVITFLTKNSRIVWFHMIVLMKRKRRSFRIWQPLRNRSVTYRLFSVVKYTTLLHAYNC